MRYLGREPSQRELFEHIYKRRSKDNGDEYVDEKSKRACERYSSSFTNKYGLDPSTQPEFDHALWMEATGGPAKGGRIYGFGTGKHAQSFARGSMTSTYIGDSTFEMMFERNYERIREQVRQEMQEEIDERIRKSNEAMEERFRMMFQ